MILHFGFNRPGAAPSSRPPFAKWGFARAPEARPGDRARRVNVTADDAVQIFRRPSLPLDARYALLDREPTRPKDKPLAYPTLAALARALHRRREGAAIQLENTERLTREREGPVQGVSAWTLGETGDRERFLGWAYLGGAGRGLLGAALDEAERERAR